MLQLIVTPDLGGSPATAITRRKSISPKISQAAVCERHAPLHGRRDHTRSSRLREPYGVNAAHQGNLPNNDTPEEPPKLPAREHASLPIRTMSLAKRRKTAGSLLGHSMPDRLRCRSPGGAEASLQVRDPLQLRRPGGDGSLEQTLRRIKNIALAAPRFKLERSSRGRDYHRETAHAAICGNPCVRSRIALVRDARSRRRSFSGSQSLPRRRS
jgi:hypothetical protein